MKRLTLVVLLALVGCHAPKSHMTPLTTGNGEPYLGPTAADYNLKSADIALIQERLEASQNADAEDAKRSAESQQVALTPDSKDPQWYRVEATEAQIAFAKEHASYELKDPSSAQFRNLYAITRGLNDDTVCGEINAKNSYGGYVGFRKFYVNSDGRHYISVPNSVLADLPDLICNKPPKP